LTLARAVDGNEELRRQLTNQHLPVGNRLRFAESEALQAAHPVTKAAVAMIIAGEHAGALAALADAVARQAATAREAEYAEVFVATPLNEKQTAALTKALERATGKTLNVQVFVDESVIGGVRAKIGDTVIDGSVARRLTDLRARLGGCPHRAASRPSKRRGRRPPWLT
jgi:F-type H+-transporting ATPase subunit delta